jgi:ABC-type transport system substrate-binding protein
MFRRTFRAVAVAIIPMAAAITFAGVASANTGQAAPASAQPVAAGIPLEPITTNPHAQYPDPIQNGAVLGAGIGSAVGSATGSGGPILGALIGALVGDLNPSVVPQVLP